MRYLVGDIKQSVAGFESVNVHRNKQPRLGRKHTEVTQGLEVIPERGRKTIRSPRDHQQRKHKLVQSASKRNHVKSVSKTNTIIFLLRDVLFKSFKHMAVTCK